MEDEILCRFCALESQGLDVRKCGDQETQRFDDLLERDDRNDRDRSKSGFVCDIHVHKQTETVGNTRKSPTSETRSSSDRRSPASYSLNIKNLELRSSRENGKMKKKKKETGYALKDVRNQKSGNGNISDSSYQKSRSTAVQRGGSTRRISRPTRSRASSYVDGTKSDCCCSRFHSHQFSCPEFYVSVLDNSAAKLEHSMARVRQDLVETNEKHLNISNTFWCPSLMLRQNSSSPKVIDFESLWPQELALRDILRDGIQNTALRAAISELTSLSLTCAPFQLLKSLIELALVRLDCTLEDGAGLLHYACLFRKSNIVQYLINLGVSPKIRDKQGYYADQVCFCPKIRRQLPQKHLHNNQGNTPNTQTLQPSVQDKDVIFRMAASPKCLYELQRKLQMFEFNVNTEINGDGDFLIHIATQGGLCQLSLIHSLVCIQNADIELGNSDGLTPLMIAAMEGSTILCDVLMCIFGADPNKCNVHTGRCALHYAAQNNHVNVVSCLIKRGADFNKEDYNGMRPDDLTRRYDNHDDCQNIINLHRAQRAQQLADTAKNSTLKPQDLWKTDLYMTDQDNFTLMMIAARYDRVQNIKALLDLSVDTVNAQYFGTLSKASTVYSTGMTALSMAAQMGHSDVVRILMMRGANPSIRDVNGYNALHHAVINNSEDVVKIMLDYFPSAYKGLYEGMKLSKKTSIHTLLKNAWQRRQDEIVSLGLMECSLSGKAEQLFCMLEEGDNINAKSGVGNWPLYLAVENGHLGVVTLLCENGADIRKRHTPTGSTVLHVSARMGHADVTDYLLELCRPLKPSKVDYMYGHFHRGLDINAFNSEEKTALQLAAEKGYLRIVRMLLLHGATTALLNSDGLLFSPPGFCGVWNEIDGQRNKHTNLIMNFIRQKSKKSFEALKKIWLPGFDHNLRDRYMDTPLMVGCREGRSEVVEHLLQSAVYPQSNNEEDDCVTSYSDNDSGVLDANGGQSCRMASSYRDEDILKSFEWSHDFGQQLTSGDFLLVNKMEQDNPARMVEALLQDVDKPKGLMIYHDGLVSHICAVNLMDGCTPLHRCIQGGDNPAIISMLIQADVTCINIQNSSGLTALHLACQLSRKKSVEKLLESREIDINMLTLTGQLPEELATNKSVLGAVQRARKGQPVRPRLEGNGEVSAPSIADSNLESERSEKPSTINFEKVQQRFQDIKKRIKE